MKRFHVHAHVDDLAASIAFYTKLFAQEPTRVESDYAKWMIDDPRINFAISTRGSKPGIDHLGIQADSSGELAELHARGASADLALLEEGTTTCCYARSQKHWVTDPQGIAWEHFHTLENIPLFNEASLANVTNEGDVANEANAAKADGGAACCAPAAPRGRAVPIALKSGSGCC